MKTLAFAGSNSSGSINQKLIDYIASSTKDVEVVHLTRYNAPLYDIDIEVNQGIPNAIQQLSKKLSETDTLVISVAEHNGYMTAFFKNIIDWLSRENRKFLESKKIILFSASPGPRGGLSALEAVKGLFPRFGGEIVSSLNIGNFNDIFKDDAVIDEGTKNQIKEELSKAGLATQ